MINFNIQSITNKLNQITLHLHEKQADFATLNEHWLRKEVINKCIIKGYNIASIFCRNNNIHGGTLILVNDQISYKERIDLRMLSVEMHVEIAAIEIQKYKTTVVSVYRPPSGDFDLFLMKINILLSIIENEIATENVIVAGDFNINFTQLSKNRNRLIDCFRSYNLHITTNEPSRITINSKTCIDNVFTNISADKYKIVTMSLHMSDHLAQKFSYEVDYKETHDTRKDLIFHRVISNDNIHLFRQKMQLLNWKQILDDQTCQQTFTTFYSIFVKYLDECFPIKSVKKMSIICMILFI